MNRLARKPSLWMNFLGRFLFGVVWAGGMSAFTWVVWVKRDANTPVFVWFVLGFFDLLAIGIVWDLVVRFWRTLMHRQPVVEIDRQSLRYGDSAQLHVVEEHPESVKEISVRLVAEHWLTTTNGGTTIRSYQPCYDQELLAISLAEAEPVSRMLQIRIPEKPPADDAKWKIVVATMLRQGGVIAHPFPIDVTPTSPQS
ncbi:MAG TPA: hypothetical protein VLV78_20210 [Thermoanaerobaculia bacterium]|nr:hypothetical protein [Thermoanaerobaculia bacterium]